MPKHKEIRCLNHKPEEMFMLVSDVAKYPEFLPWCKAARITSRTDNHITADLIIGFKGFSEKFTSHIILDKDNNKIDVTYQDGPFKYLENQWIFNESNDGCEVDFYVDFEFKSKILQTVIGLVFNEAVKKMVNAFEKRADFLYHKIKNLK